MAFLLEEMWDDENGGFVWEVERDGTTNKPNRHLYGQSFGLYALSEYARAAETADAGEYSTEAADYAHELVDLIDGTRQGRGTTAATSSTSRRSGNRSRPVRPTSRILNPTGRPKGVRRQRPRSDAEADEHPPSPDGGFYNLLRSFRGPRPAAADSTNCSTSTPTRSTGRNGAFVLTSTTPTGRRNSMTKSFGSSRTATISRTCGWRWRPPTHSSYRRTSLWSLFETLWDYSLEYGYDHEHGGFYFYGGFDEPASFRVKAWWVQAECMTSALRTYERTGDDRYLDVFRETWDFIQQYHVDGEYGEWHSGVDEDLQPVGRKGRSTRARITTDGHFSSVSPPSNDYRFWEGNRSRGDPVSFDVV